jgi:hypothetical protein
LVMATRTSSPMADTFQRIGMILQIQAAGW